ncbi:MAG: FAD-dependent oxidoreductase [Lachnospiraceae bacterium]|jgi:succinate dehydrogenase/fumarate reductase flavoprotein subunit/uncharacterized protein with FMN-binding domain|nr:FAD-dependent oxidoreductase [Lachnospiraceae bacterium]
MTGKRCRQLCAWLLTVSLGLGTGCGTPQGGTTDGKESVSQESTSRKDGSGESASGDMSQTKGQEQESTDSEFVGAQGNIASYSAVAKGYGELSVTIQVEDTKVSAIIIDGPDETDQVGGAAIEEYFAPAFANLVGTELDQLSFDAIDGVAGATLTSNGVLAAARGALAQAGVKPQKAMTPGTYRAAALGYKDNPGKVSNGMLDVTVTVSEDEILDIRVDFARDEQGNILEKNGASLTENPRYADVFEEEPYAYIQTTNYGGFALEILTKQILEGQSVAVDAVSNATYTSAGFLSAVTDCLKQAGAPESFYLSGAVTEESRTEKAQVVVIGAGGSGLTAAASALEAGADVILLEKQDFTGGTTASSNAATRVTNSQLFLAATSGMGEDLVGSADQAELDAYTAARTEDPAAYTSLTWFWYNETLKNGYKGWYDIDLIHYVAENGGHFVDWLMDTVNIPYSLDKIPDLATARSHRPYDVGANPFENGSRPLKGYMRAYGLTHGLEEYFVNHGGRLMLNTEAVSLLTDEAGNVTGVTAIQTVRNGKSTVRTTCTIQADAVVIATGGIDNNPEMMAEFTPYLQYTNSLGARAGDTGDGITMAYYDERVGAVVQFNGYAPTAGQAGLRNTDALKAANVASNVRYDTGLMVSLQGNVIDYEGYVQDAGIVALWDDALYQARYELPTGVWFGLIPAGGLEESARAAADAVEAAGVRAVYKADTVEELIAILIQEDQMDGDALRRTIEEWNKSDVEENLKMQGNGPFYAITSVPSTNGSYGGLKTDNSFRVLRLKPDAASYAASLTVPEGNYISDDFRTIRYATHDFWKTVDEDKLYEPVGGLYACGEVATSEFYGTIYPSAGTSIGLGVTMGRTAGLAAAAYALGDACEYRYIPHSKAIIELAEGELEMGAYYSFSGRGAAGSEEGETVTLSIRPLTGVEMSKDMRIRCGDREYGYEDMTEDGRILVELQIREKEPQKVLTIDWDGDGEKYKSSVYTMDFSGISWE